MSDYGGRYNYRGGNGKRGGNGWRGNWRYNRGRGGPYNRGGATNKNYNNNNNWNKNDGNNFDGSFSSSPFDSSCSSLGLIPLVHDRGSSKQQKTMYDIPSPYSGWKIYFPDQMYSPTSKIVTQIETFLSYIRVSKEQWNLTSIEEKGSMIVDFRDLSSNKDVSAALPSLQHDLQTEPETFLNSLCVAAYQLLFDDLGPTNLFCESKIPYTVIRLHCRVTNLGHVTPLKNVKANYYGKFISVKGTVVRVGCTRPLCVQMAYQCNLCSHVQAGKWINGKFSIPTSCPELDCRSKMFTPLRGNPLTCTVDFQNIRLQEQMNDENREPGRIPRTIDCELTYDLVDTCVPGDVVNISGIVKVTSSNEENTRQKDQCLFLPYIEVNSIISSRPTSMVTMTTSSTASFSQVNGDYAEKKEYTNVEDSGIGQASQGGLSMEFSIKELYAIEEIHSDKQLFKLVVGSLCPTIYGHEMVKAGLILGLFGGTQRFVDDKNSVPIRGDPHVLVVGDPGLGKSQMLQCVSNLAPRGVYVCANTTTTSGLTVTLTKEAGGGGDNVLEAGALVLADQGCCCIDEFDKLGANYQALLEAMEQQTLSIAKAGIVCSLPARTSVIAAANPSGGHYNRAKTVAENLRMGSALLSRFDLVFILLDKPDEDVDSKLSEYVMALHAGKPRSAAATPASKLSRLCGRSGTDSRFEAESPLDVPLSERLKVLQNENFDPIPPILLRKYIGYARMYVRPKLSQEAAVVLKDFYLNLRKNHQTKDSTPITTRQLESLIRLTEARARVELREEATEQDAMEVIEIMKYSMIDTFSDELGMLDFQRSQHGSGSSSRSQAKKFISLLQKSSRVNGNNCLFNINELKQIMVAGGIVVKDFETFIASLNDQGYLLKKGPKIYQLQTTDF